MEGVPGQKEKKRKKKEAHHLRGWWRNEGRDRRSRGSGVIGQHVGRGIATREFLIKVLRCLIQLRIRVLSAGVCVHTRHGRIGLRRRLGVCGIHGLSGGIGGLLPRGWLGDGTEATKLGGHRSVELLIGRVLLNREDHGDSGVLGQLGAVVIRRGLRDGGLHLHDNAHVNRRILHLTIQLASDGRLGLVENNVIILADVAKNLSGEEHVEAVIVDFSHQELRVKKKEEQEEKKLRHGRGEEEKKEKKEKKEKRKKKGGGLHWR